MLHFAFCHKEKEGERSHYFPKKTLKRIIRVVSLYSVINKPLKTEAK